jgi:hypothetical protein
MAEMIKSVLFTRDRRVFFENGSGDIREATAVERIEALAALLARNMSASPDSQHISQEGDDGRRSQDVHAP